MEYVIIVVAVLIGTGIIYLLQPNARFFSRFNWGDEPRKDKKQEKDKKQDSNSTTD